ncbi:hypothetical protein CL617_02580 [archaeon]|nr:hypothetical protein [archaeon]|tara:strand:+ start:1180 stop:1710 length:531 start_codon:yes stop_codon:yes gene_type:complete
MDNIIEYFIKETEREFHVRELAKLTRKSPTTISKYLSELKKEDLLTSRKKFNHLLFKANTENTNFKDLKLYYNIKKLRESKLINYLIEKLNHPEAIILFGSYQKAENTVNSDIDILIVTSSKKPLSLENFEKILGHKIQLFLHSNNDIDKMKTQNKELLNNILNGTILYGYLEIFK